MNYFIHADLFTRIVLKMCKFENKFFINILN